MPFLFAFVVGTAALLFAVLLLPFAAGVGAGAELVGGKLDAASADFKKIHRFPERSIVYAGDGSVLHKFIGDQNRVLVRLKQVSEQAKDAVLAIEDDGFYEHGALDLTSVARAMLANLAAGEIVQGGSTLTQQLVKNAVIGDPARTYERKFRELAVALKVEQQYTKDEILEMYLNQVYLGNGVYGIGTAAHFYFDQPASELTLAESALLAGLISSPETYDPLDHPKRAKRRRNEVLERLAQLGWYRDAKIEKLKETPLGLPPDAGKRVRKIEPFFVYYLKKLILDDANKEFASLGKTYEQRLNTVFQGGLRIYTTLDPEWQRYGEAALRHGLPAENGPNGSLVSVETRTGAIRAMVSGKDYLGDPHHTDLVWQGRRQTGSAFKPFTLVAAFRQGIPPTRVYSSTPFCSEDWPSATGGKGCVNNAEPGSHGSMDLWSATAFSVNVIFARLILDVGADDVVEAAHDMGITAPLDAVPSMTLGAEEVSTLDMASAFGTLANDGKHCEPFAVTRVIGPDGKTVYRHKPECVQAIKADIAHLVTAMLEGVVDHGTGTVANDGMESRPIAGKTGTAQDYTNLYFTGYTRQISTAVWVGMPSGQIPLDGFFSSPFGGRVAAPIWNEFMRQATAGMRIEGFPPPPGPDEDEVPDVVGMTSAEAQRAILKAGFFPQVVRVDSLQPESTVIAQSPPGGSTAIIGEYVRISVSTGEIPEVVIPAVEGKTEAKATRALEAAGFAVNVATKDVTDPALDGKVVDQTPRAGVKLPKGETVLITVGVLVEEGDGGGGGGGGGPPD